MPTIFQEIQRYMSRLKAQGTTRVWISPENMQALYKLPTASRQDFRPQMQPLRTAPAVQHPSIQPTAFQPPAPLGRIPVPAPQGRMSMPAAPQGRMSIMDSYGRQPMQTQTPVTPHPDLANLGWDDLYAAALSCRACRLYACRKNMVFEDGCRKARVMFIGEGPGMDEDIQGKPFVGRAGQLLTKMILAMGLNRDSDDPATGAYIANIVKCRPPQNRNPLPDEGDVCVDYVKRQIELVKPEAIILLGAVPLSFLLKRTGIMRLRGQWLDYGGIPVMPTFHPSYLLRLETRGQEVVKAEKRKVWQDLQQVMARLGLKRPQ